MRLALSRAAGLIVFMVLAISAVGATPVRAYQIRQTATPLRGDFVLEPAKIEISLSPGESSIVDLKITNRAQDARQFTVSTEDTAGSDDPSTPIVLLGDKTGPWSLKGDLKPEKTSFTLLPGEQIDLPVTVALPATAEPGGRYASVVISNSSGGVGGTGSLTVARLTALFFVRVPGNVQENGTLESFTSSALNVMTDEHPIEFDILFKNDGNVHLDPHGRIAITDMYGATVSAITVDPFYTMPLSARDRTLTWNHGVLFGRYVATLTLDRGYASATTTDTRTLIFWVLPIGYLVGSLLVAVLIILLAWRLVRTFEIRRR